MKFLFLISLMTDIQERKKHTKGEVGILKRENVCVFSPSLCDVFHPFAGNKNGCCKRTKIGEKKNKQSNYLVRSPKRILRGSPEGAPQILI